MEGGCADFDCFIFSSSTSRERTSSSPRLLSSPPAAVNQDYYSARPDQKGGREGQNNEEGPLRRLVHSLLRTGVTSAGEVVNPCAFIAPSLPSVHVVSVGGEGCAGRNSAGRRTDAQVAHLTV